VTAALTCTGVRAGYGKTTVVREFDLTAAPGEVVALLGPNGAGKTTLMMTIAGLLPRQAGEITSHGLTLRSGRPGAAAKVGVVLVPDSRALFSSLTVAENLKVAAGKRGDDPRSMLDVFPGLRTRWEVSAGALSGGEQQMLAVARALVQRPKVLLVDEMSMGLAPVVVQSLLPIMRRVADERGVVVVLVEQHVRLALEVADHAVVLVHGAVAIRCPAAELRADLGRIEAAYLGRSQTSAAASGA
jgi:branched-chain amino acid transport system ATP-binding protein